MIGSLKRAYLWNKTSAKHIAYLLREKMAVREIDVRPKRYGHMYSAILLINAALVGYSLGCIKNHRKKKMPICPPPPEPPPPPKGQKEKKVDTVKCLKAPKEHPRCPVDSNSPPKKCGTTK